MARKFLHGFIFDGWNSLMFAIEEMGKAIDRAWEGDE